MKTKFIALGLVAAALAATVAFADDNMQGNDQSMSAQSPAMTPNAPAATTTDNNTPPASTDSSSADMQMQTANGSN